MGKGRIQGNGKKPYWMCEFQIPNTNHKLLYYGQKVPCEVKSGIASLDEDTNQIESLVLRNPHE